MVSLGSVWERQDVENSELVLYWGRAEPISVGTDSDAFVRLLDGVYRTGLGRKKMRDRLPFLAVSLAGDPARLEHELTKLKFYFESDTERYSRPMRTFASEWSHESGTGST
jgi:hypothetical protein